MSSAYKVRRASVHDASALLAAVLAEGKAQSCASLKWDVLPGKLRAQAFYRSLGGAPDTQWQGWIRCLD